MHGMGEDGDNSAIKCAREWGGDGEHNGGDGDGTGHAGMG